MDQLSERGIPRQEFSSLAPDIPEGLERLGHFNAYSITTNKDGSSSVVSRLQKMDGQQTGHRVVDNQQLTPQDMEKHEAWIAKAWTAVHSGKATPQQVHQLGIADEIIQIVSNDFRTAQGKKSSTSKPSL